MFLVHLTFEPPPAGSPLPADIAFLISSCATRAEALEHITVHAAARPCPVVGLFLRCPDLAAAEAAADRLWRRTVDRYPQLGACRLRRAEVPLLLPQMIWTDPP
ncbi:hypothetical protein I2W78_10890 [Streptomyces spinoverrucosus]|uniref:hypothetical protein n=1 Tax=Streptomyces spinoverrucosus TaxID=284043 RepID=UPI0018C3D0CB|nr:hypothetical protein [Streptomyces spinoverrucosus]MBG0852323.1 hypothetical protein [Streptomyces spinoverrucosus]